MLSYSSASILSRRAQWRMRYSRSVSCGAHVSVAVAVDETVDAEAAVADVTALAVAEASDAIVDVASEVAVAPPLLSESADSASDSLLIVSLVVQGQMARVYCVVCRLRARERASEGLNDCG